MLVENGRWQVDAVVFKWIGFCSGHSIVVDLELWQDHLGNGVVWIAIDLIGPGFAILPTMVSLASQLALPEVPNPASDPTTWQRHIYPHLNSDSR